MARPLPLQVLVFPEEKEELHQLQHHRKIFKERVVVARAETAIKQSNCERMRAVIVRDELVDAAFSVPSKVPKMAGNLCRKSGFTRNLHSLLFLSCGILFCTTFLFVLSTVDTPIDSEQQSTTTRVGSSRFSIPMKLRLFYGMDTSPVGKTEQKDGDVGETALHGLGAIFRNGTKAVDELIVVNLSENLLLEDFRLFLRTLHRSGATATADIAFLFPWTPIPAAVVEVIQQEESSFLNLIVDFSTTMPPEAWIEESTLSNQLTSLAISSFNGMAFIKAALIHNTQRGGFVWGNRNGSPNQEDRFGWGSIVGFQMGELDPDNVLTGFIDDPPAQLRRWVCYQMLLGLVRRRFKKVMLIELGQVAILGDPLAAVRKKDCLYLTLEDNTWNEKVLPLKDEVGEKVKVLKVKGRSSRRNNSTKVMRPIKGKQSIMERVYGTEFWGSLDTVERERKIVNSGVIMGSLRSVEGLANVMVTEIVGVALQAKSRQSFPDKALLSYLTQKSSVLGKKVMHHLQIVSNEESAFHSRDGSRQPQVFFRRNGKKYALIHASARFDPRNESMNLSSDVGDLVRKDICSWAVSAVVYDDCKVGSPG